METFQAALAIAEALARTDEKNLEAQRDHAICLNKVGNEWDALREYAKAEAVFARRWRSASGRC